jgi:S1-C subfamily serine protease
MRISRTILALVLLSLIAAPVLAGSGQKCTAGTQECLDKMAKSLQNRGWVGIEMDEVDGTKHWKVTLVVSGSPAEKAGLQAGDVITGINGIEFSDDNQDKLEKIKKSMTPGETIKYMVKREGNGIKVAVTLDKLPEDVLAQWVGKHMLDHASMAVAKK